MCITTVKTSVHHLHCLPLSLLLHLFLSGWFCVSAAWNSQPFDLDNYTNANCLCPATSTGGRCQVGFYCPIASSEPLPCPPGTFCNISGIWTLMGQFHSRPFGGAHITLQKGMSVCRPNNLGYIKQITNVLTLIKRFGSADGSLLPWVLLCGRSH